jgi:hypothetical protein
VFELFDPLRPDPPEPPRHPIPPEVGARHDELDALGDRIADLSARIQAATDQLLVLLREYDLRGGWDAGFKSCAHWLNWRTGLNLGAAREKVRVARALADLPLLSEAMRRGELSYSKVRALTRIATPEIEADMMDFARAGTAHQVERLVRSWRLVDRLEAAERDETRRRHHRLVAYTDDDGMVVVRGRLDPETGAVVLRALEAAADRLNEPGKEEPGARRADALGLLAESALAHDLDPGTRGDRYQVVLHVDAEVLAEPEPDAATERPGMAMLEDGVGVSAATSRRFTCDCATVTMTHDAEGNILDLGRKTRTISPALRRALTFRDPTCRFPGCSITVCEGHHVQHWADGGETKLGNILHACKRHHRCLHEEGFRVELLPNGEARFFNPYGYEIPHVPAPPRVAAETPRGPLAPITDHLERHRILIGPWTGCSSWDGKPVDYQWALDTMWRPRASGEESEGERKE